MIFLILLFICLCVSITTFIVYIRGDLFSSSNDTPVIKKIAPKSAYPEYLGMKGPDVIVELNSKYPQYTVEVIAPDYIKDIDVTNYREDRIRIFVSRSGLVQNITKG